MWWSIFPSFSSILAAIFNLWGIFQVPEYDAIIVGTGPGGCPLAQTLIEGDLRVLMVERGDERGPATNNLRLIPQAFRDVCIEKIDDDGVWLPTGNCVGGASSASGGVWIEEDPNELLAQIPYTEAEFASVTDMQAAFEWNRDQVAPIPTEEPAGSNAEKHIQDLIDVANSRSDFNVGNTNGQPGIDPDGVFRTHSHFIPPGGERRPADYVLDRSNPLLSMRVRTKVRKILFEGDWLIPFRARFPNSSGEPRARCVQLTTLETVCVKEHGRIYLSAGIFHTPELLLRSGVGPNGSKHINPEVGQNLEDKPAIVLMASFQPDFDYSGQSTVGNLAFSQQYTPAVGDTSPKTMLYEEYSYGFPATLDLIQFERNTLPRSVRTGLFGDVYYGIVDICKGKVENPGILNQLFGLGPICGDVGKFNDVGCASKTYGIEFFMGNPTSKGSVTLDWLGNLKVSVNYLGTPEDRDAFTQGAKVARELLAGIQGPGAAQQPCEDKNDVACMAQSCPDILAQIEGLTRQTVGLATLLSSPVMFEAPADAIYPHFLAETIAPEEFETSINEFVFTGASFAGTAELGKVVDSSFRVMGTQGLYVSDGSVFAEAPRVNPIANIMMMSRLAGLKYIEEL